MSTSKIGNRYDEDFKRTLVNMYQSGVKSQATLCKEYGVSITALGVESNNIQPLKRMMSKFLPQNKSKNFKNVKLNLKKNLTKKVIAIFTPHSNND